MKLKNEIILASGMILISVGFLFGEFTNFEYGDIQVSRFLEGFFVGLAIVMNIIYIVRTRTAKTNTPATS